jgi:putative transposon-encoded protein
MSLLTPWGYTLTNANDLSDILTVADFNTRTANKYASDSRVAGAIASASQAIRDNVGWHLLPSAACEMQTSFFDKRVTLVDRSAHIQLPSRYVTAITSITIGDQDYPAYYLESNGLLKVFGVLYSRVSPYAVIKIKYTAGLPDALSNTLKDIVVNRAVKSLAQSYGIQSETAGGLSISYSASWSNDASSSTLSPAEEAALAPYRLRGVF